MQCRLYEIGNPGHRIYLQQVVSLLDVMADIGSPGNRIYLQQVVSLLDVMAEGTGLVLAFELMTGDLGEFALYCYNILLLKQF